jgi:hypothetical protein
MADAMYAVTAVANKFRDASPDIKKTKYIHQFTGEGLMQGPVMNVSGRASAHQLTCVHPLQTLVRWRLSAAAAVSGLIRTPWMRNVSGLLSV